MSKGIKLVVERCAYDTITDGNIDITEIIESKVFMVPVTYSHEKLYYEPNNKKEMLRPYIYLIELAVLDNYDYVDIASAVNLSDEFFKCVDDYEPADEPYLIEMLANLLFDEGINMLVLPRTTIVYRLLHTGIEEMTEVTE